MNLFDMGYDTKFDYIVQGRDAYFLISVHNSNDKIKFAEQWSVIREFIESHPKERVVVCGDFNANVQSYGKRLVFVDKEDKTKLIFSHIFNRNINTSLFVSTTGKVRCLTSQITKMLEPAFSSIDGFIVFSAVDEEKIDMRSAALYVDNTEHTLLKVEDQPIYPPLGWPSDHALIYAEINDSLKVFSINAFGESISESDSFNIFEIFTKKCWDTYQSNPSIQAAFERVKRTFLDREYEIPSSGEVKSIKQLVKEKYFSTITRPYAIAGSVFQPPRGFRRHEDSMSLFRVTDTMEFSDKLIDIYDIELYTFYNEMKQRHLENDLNSSISEEERNRERLKIKDIEVAVKTITDFYELVIHDPELRQFFIHWYQELMNVEKINIDYLIKSVFNTYKPTHFCLQEVSRGMMRMFKSKESEYRAFGYTCEFVDDHEFVIPGHKNKTRGLIFVRL